MMRKIIFGAALTLTAATLGGCIQSAIVPLRPVGTRSVVVLEPASELDEAATMPATTAATATASAPATSAATATAPATAASVAATAPAPRMVAHTIDVVDDPNQTTRYVYLGDYDLIWNQAKKLLADWNYRLDEQDYRRGVLLTLPLDQAQLVEPLRFDQHGLLPALESTVNHQRISIRITISTVPNKPKFYEIGVQALVEREANPSEVIGGQLYAGASAFGERIITLRSDYLVDKLTPAYWYVLGRDPRLEKVVLSALLKKI
jgi:hypothetical protein